MKYIYGPVSSWRLGISLGIDLLSQAEKICTFDCTYCQIGRTSAVSTDRSVYVPTQEIVRELRELPELKIDYITLAGRGEPCLAENLGEVIVAVKTLMARPVAVLTNATLMDRDDVRQELSLADVVVAKLDAWSQESFELINNPVQGISFERIYQGIKRFRQEYQGKLALQMMFVPENKDAAREMAEMAFEINPDEVQINTPLRPCGISPLSREEISRIQECFQGLPTISAYDTEHNHDEPISIFDTAKRRGKKEVDSEQLAVGRKEGIL